MTESVQSAFLPVVVGRELRHVIFESPAGQRAGYEMRFELEVPGSGEARFSEWLHLPDPLMLQLTQSLDAFMRSEGHLRL